MKRVNLLAVVACSAASILGLTLVVAHAAANFGGTWIMDKSRSVGLPPDMEQTMTVTQADTKLDIETKIVTDQGDQAVTATYNLDPKEMDYTPKRGGTEGKGKRTLKMNADGNGFEVKEEEKFDSMNGEVVFQFVRKWELAADGKTLTIELEVTGPNGPQHTKRTFVRK